MTNTNVSVKQYDTCKKDYSWNSSTCTCKKSRHLKSTVDNLVIAFNEIISVMDNVSTNVANTISSNVMSTLSINCDNKKAI